MLRDGEECRRALAVQVLQQLVQVQDEKLLFRHGGLVAVQAVDGHQLGLVAIHVLAYAMGELAR